MQPSILFFIFISPPSSRRTLSFLPTNPPSDRDLRSRWSVSTASFRAPAFRPSPEAPLEGVLGAAAIVDVVGVVVVEKVIIPAVFVCVIVVGIGAIALLFPPRSHRRCQCYLF